MVRVLGGSFDAGRDGGTDALIGHQRGVVPTSQKARLSPFFASFFAQPPSSPRQRITDGESHARPNRLP